MPDRDPNAELTVRMRAILNATSDAILVTDAHNVATDVNESFLTMWQGDRATVIGQHIEQIFASSEHHNSDKLLSRLKAIANTSDDVVEELHREDGRIIELLSRAQLLDGEAIGRVWGFRDVTDRNAADEARFRLAAIIESSNDAIISKNLQGIVVSWNSGAEEVFGYSAEEMVGKPILTLIPPDRHDEEIDILSRIRRGERIEHYETVRRRKDGSLIPIALTVSPVRNDRGEIIGASKIARDITERKLSEEEDSQTLELLNKTGRVVNSTLNVQEILQSVTDAATELSGAEFGAFFYNTTDQNGDAFLLYTLSGAPKEAFDGFGHPRATALFGPTFRGEGTIRIANVLEDSRYGQMAPFHGMPPGHLPVRSYLAVPVTSRTGEVIGGLFFGSSKIGVFSEREERLIIGVAAQAAVAIDNARLYEGVKKSAEERESMLEAERAARTEAERVSVMKDEFLATLSHELRTPLTAILGWAQVLSAGSVSQVDVDEGLEAIQRNARIQTQLIEDLLDMSRIVSGKVRLDVQWCDLTTVVEGAVSSVRPSADAKGIRLRTILDPHASPVSGDPTRLQQIVWNLLSNAIKFTPKEGSVDVFLERVNSHLEITVRDTGVGIAPEFLPHVFERFRQADSSTTRAHGGLGLGLAIVKNLVELHGGVIRVKSGGAGQGTTFIVALPLAPVRAGEQREHPSARSMSLPLREKLDLGGVKVLVVDDEPDARNIITRILTDCNAVVVTASSADEALQSLKREKPNVIVSDIGMPDKNGYELIGEIRGLAPPLNQIPAVALTAFARSEDRMRAMMAGYQMHISKPIEPQELIVTVGSLAGRIVKLKL